MTLGRRPSIVRVMTPCVASLCVMFYAHAGPDDTRVDEMLSARIDRIEHRFDRIESILFATALLGTGAGGVLAYREDRRNKRGSA